MKIELTRLALIDAFKESLTDMTFIEKSDHQKILERLDELVEAKSKYEKAVASSKLWKILFYRSMKSLTTNERGVSELFGYLEELIEYEDVLFAVDPHHREHVIHSIWVMLIGVYLMRNNQAFHRINFIDAIGNFNTEEKPHPQYTQALESLYEKQFHIWLIASLTHDLGYPIQKTRYVNSRMAHILRNFGFLSLQEFKYDFTVVHQPAINVLLDTLSSKVMYFDDGFRVVVSPGDRLDYAKTFENIDHGVMSAYLLLIKLDWLCEALVQMGTYQNMVLSINEGIEQTIVSAILKSIASHTNINRYGDVINTLSSLLFICDELEEFSRYCRSESTHEWMEAKIRTECDISSKILSISFTFQDYSEEPEHNLEKYFRNKVDKVTRRYNICKDNIENINIVCSDSTKAKHPQWSYVSKLGSPSVIIDPEGNQKEQPSLITSLT